MWYFANHGPYERKKKMPPPGSECCNVFYIWFVCILFFGVELGDWFEVVVGPGVMDRPGSEAIGIGAEANVKNSELFASAERWRPILEACHVLLHVATIPQVTCLLLYIYLGSYRHSVPSKSTRSYMLERRLYQKAPAEYKYRAMTRVLVRSRTP